MRQVRKMRKLNKTTERPGAESPTPPSEKFEPLKQDNTSGLTSKVIQQNSMNKKQRPASPWLIKSLINYTKPYFQEETDTKRNDPGM